MWDLLTNSYMIIDLYRGDLTSSLLRPSKGLVELVNLMGSVPAKSCCVISSLTSMGSFWNPFQVCVGATPSTNGIMFSLAFSRQRGTSTLKETLAGNSVMPLSPRKLESKLSRLL